MKYLIITIVFVAGMYIGLSFPMETVSEPIGAVVEPIDLTQKDAEIADLTAELERRGNIKAKRVFIDDNLVVDLSVQTTDEVTYTVGNKTCICK